MISQLVPIGILNNFEETRYCQSEQKYCLGKNSINHVPTAPQVKSNCSIYLAVIITKNNDLYFLQRISARVCKPDLRNKYLIKYKDFDEFIW